MSGCVLESPYLGALCWSVIGDCDISWNMFLFLCVMKCLVLFLTLVEEERLSCFAYCAMGKVAWADSEGEQEIRTPTPWQKSQLALSFLSVMSWQTVRDCGISWSY